MDLMMPVMDGWALREALVAHPVWGRIPLIVLSASLPPNQSPSFGTFLAKPVDLDRLHGIIRAKLSDGGEQCRDDDKRGGTEHGGCELTSRARRIWWRSSMPLSQGH